MRNFPKKPLILSILFFCVFLSAFLYLYRQINNKNDELQLKETEFQTEALRRDEIKALDNSVKIIEMERVQLDTHFARSSDVVPFLDTIEKLAISAHNEAEVVSVNILEDNSGLLVGMKASGAFPGLYKFLTLLENSSYELEFVSMDLQNELGPDILDSNSKNPKWNMNFNIKLLTFIQ